MRCDAFGRGEGISFFRRRFSGRTRCEALERRARLTIWRVGVFARAGALRAAFLRAVLLDAARLVVLRAVTFLRERAAEALARVLRVALRLAVALTGFRLLVGLRAVVFLVVPRVAERLRVLARFFVLERLVFARFNEPPVNALGDWRHNLSGIVPTGRGLAKLFLTGSRAVKLYGIQ